MLGFGYSERPESPNYCRDYPGSNMPSVGGFDALGIEQADVGWPTSNFGRRKPLALGNQVSPIGTDGSADG